jgi:protein associated with RNAse G/E
MLKKIEIISKKYDGSFRDEYHGFLAAENEERLLVYTPPGTMSYDHRKHAWCEATDGLLEIYFKTRWYVVWHICEQHSNVNQTYTHIAMPPTVTPGSIEWVDLDLDYRVHLDGRIERLDDAEYQENRIRMSYPHEVDVHVQAACSEVELLCAQQVYPFDYAQQVAVYRQIAANVQKAGT